MYVSGQWLQIVRDRVPTRKRTAGEWRKKKFCLVVTAPHCSKLHRLPVQDQRPVFEKPCIIMPSVHQCSFAPQSNEFSFVQRSRLIAFEQAIYTMTVKASVSAKLGFLTLPELLEPFDTRDIVALLMVLRLGPRRILERS